MTIILCSLFSMRAAKLIKKGDLDSVGTYSIEKREMLHARMKIILLFLRFFDCFLRFFVTFASLLHIGDMEQTKADKLYIFFDTETTGVPRDYKAPSTDKVLMMP